MAGELDIGEKEKSCKERQRNNKGESILRGFCQGKNKAKSRKGQAGGDSEGNLPVPKADHLK